MREKNDQLDQRQSYRCPVAEPRRGCALNIGGVPYEAILLDQSAGGFSALVQLAAEPRAGQKAVLQTDAGRFNVRLAHVAHALPPDAEELPAAPETDESAAWYRLGFERLGEADELPPPHYGPWFGCFVRLRQYQTSPQLFVLCGAALALIAVLAAMALTNGDKRKCATSPAANKAASGDWKPTKKTPAADVAGRPHSHAPEARFDFATASDGAAAVEALRGMLRRIDGPTPLALPEVIDMLRLTPEQQARITRIIDTVAEAIRLLDARAAAEGISREQVSRLRGELLDQSRHEAEQVLDQRQRQQWQRLTAPPKQ